VWDAVVGQRPAVDQLRAAVEQGPVHAYLFVGPPGSSRREAARAFAALVMTGIDDPGDRDVRLILSGTHPDVREVRRTGPAINAEQAREIIRETSLAPTEGDRKVMILEEFHLLQPAAAARLLKTIEEPPPSTTFVILCDFVPADLVTIASRCARIDFTAVPADVIAARLVADGISPAVAMPAAAAAMGDLDRARLLATDPGLVERRRLCTAIPDRLDGSGSAALAAAADLLAAIDAATGPLTERHAAEVDELDQRIKASGERGSGKKQLEERHRRELRRLRADELRAALATIAESYRTAATDTATGARTGSPHEFAAAVHRIHDAIETIDRNVNERLLIEHLLWSLPTL
jgi:DNA polymerase-3 subunit delta'